MRVPVIPILVAVSLLAGVVYLFNASGGKRTMGAPRLNRIAHVDGVETEVALAPDGQRCAVVASGALWLLNLGDGSRRRIDAAPQPASFPAWSPDGRRISFTHGSDTLALSADSEFATAVVLKNNATELSWSPGGRLAFVRNRALWVSDAAGREEKEIVAGDPNPAIAIHAPRFSPDSVQIAFIKSLLDLTGEVWVADALAGGARAVVADRAAENPMDTGWLDPAHLVYLTDRSGSYALWEVDFEKNVISPITTPLFSVPLSRIGIAVEKDRIVLPRHFVDSNIVLSDGSSVAKTTDVEFEPAVSPDGKTIAYVIAKENKFEIWTAGVDGSNPTFRTDGSQPRFAPDGIHLVYAYTDLTGNEDIWRTDLRNGATERLTDAEEIDCAPDPSPDGEWIVFTSARGVATSVWTLPSAGGKRLRITDGGYGPRFSPDSKSILFWNNGSFWMVDPDGGHLRQTHAHSSTPSIGVWTRQGAAFLVNDEIQNETGKTLFKSPKPLWPQFDVLPDGRWVVAPIDIRETGLWSVDLVYVTQ